MIGYRVLRSDSVETKALISFCAGWSGWNVTVYVPTSMGNFSDFPWDPSARQAVSSAIVPYLSFQNNFAQAFPVTPADNFALIATSNIAVSAGSHQFCTSSQAGSWLFVNGSLLVTNDYYSNCWYYLRYGYYWLYWYCVNPACQYIQLNEGVHNITVNYFKHQALFGSRAALEVSMDGSLIILDGKPLRLCITLEVYIGIGRGVKLFRRSQYLRYGLR